MIRIEKLTLNIGTGKEQDKLEKAVKLLKNITGLNPIKTTAKKRIPDWGLRIGLPIGCKLTIRKAMAKELIARLLQAKENKLKPAQFDDKGNVAFGIHEYIDIPGANYDPAIGIMGLQACVTLEKIGYRIKRRKIQQKKLPPRAVIKKDEAIKFMQNEFNVDIEESE